VRKILAEHQPRELDPAAEKELRKYVDRVRKRSVADFEAAEWED
jgi:trimethylamine:corrinoid methyltransferase-like protein